MSNPDIVIANYDCLGVTLTMGADAAIQQQRMNSKHCVVPSELNVVFFIKERDVSAYK